MFLDLNICEGGAETLKSLAGATALIVDLAISSSTGVAPCNIWI